MNNNPIGILDSGVGGLTVLEAVTHELPNESIVYIGDSKNTPYGTKNVEEVHLLAKRMIEFLRTKKVKLILIACNTITVHCLEQLRVEYPTLPLIGTVPVVKTAAEVTKNKRIGILSTTNTAHSAYQKHLIETFADGCAVFNHGTDALVPLIEEGKLEGEEMALVLRHVLAPFQREQVDTIALGCTHYPLVRSKMQQLLGDKVQLLDSGGALARQVKRVLEHNNALSAKSSSTISLFTTGNSAIVEKILPAILKNRSLAVEEIRLPYDH